MLSSLIVTVLTHCIISPVVATGQHGNWNLQSLCGETVSRLQVPTDQSFVHQLIEGGIGELPDGELGTLTEDATQPEQAPPPMLPTLVPISGIIIIATCYHQ